MSIESLFGLTALGNTQSDWGFGPRRYTFRQRRDTLDLLAIYSHGDLGNLPTTETIDRTIEVLRIQANGDVEVHGEIFTKTGAFRSTETVCFSSLNDENDIVSFRRGNGPGSEALRVLSDGSVQGAWAAALTLKSQAVPASVGNPDAATTPCFRMTSLAVPDADQPFLVMAAGAAVGIPPLPPAFFSIYGSPTTGATLDVSDGVNRRALVLQAADITWKGGTGTPTQALKLTGTGATGVTANIGDSANLRAFTLEALNITWKGGTTTIAQTAKLTGSSTVGLTLDVSDGTTLRPFVIQANTLTWNGGGASPARTLVITGTSATGAVLNVGDGAHLRSLTLEAKDVTWKGGDATAAQTARLTGTSTTGLTLEVSDGSTLREAIIKSSALQWTQSTRALLLSRASTTTTVDIGTGSSPDDLVIQAASIKFVDAAGAGNTWGVLDYSGGSVLKTLAALTISSRNAADSADQAIVLTASAATIVTSAGALIVQNSLSSPTESITLDPAGVVAVKVASGASATLRLDSTVNTNGDQWDVVSETSAGELQFIDQSATAVVRITPGGALYTSGYIGPKHATTKPSNTAGEVGAIAIDTSAKKIWVKLTTGATDNWWYAQLAQ